MSGKLHVFAKGETYATIAAKYRTTVAEINKLNPPVATLEAQDPVWLP